MSTLKAIKKIVFEIYKINFIYINFDLKNFKDYDTIYDIIVVAKGNVSMKESITKFLYKGTAYTAAISLLFFLFVKILGAATPQISFSRYMIILSFGMIVSAAEFIFLIKDVPRPLQYLIHYLVLAISFFVVFLTIRNSGGSFRFKASSIFAGLVIFSCFYFLIFGAVLLFKKIILKNDKKQNNTPEKEKNEKVEYAPRFK